MKFTRIFRKYSRQLVLVFMSLLLVVFLLEGAVSRMASQWNDPNQKLGEADGKPIYSADVRASAADLSMLRALGVLPFELDPLDFYLLHREAQLAGVRVGVEQVKKLLGDANLGPRVEQIRTNYNRSLESIYESIASWLSVQELVSLQVDALADSAPRLQQAYRDQNQSATVRLSVLEAKAFLAGIPEPTAEQIQQAFDQSKDRKVAHTGDELVFGYLQPDRVMIEYLTVDPQQIQTKVQVREAEAKRYYEEHKAEYAETVVKTPEPGTSQPATPQTETVQRTYEEVQDRVRTELRQAKAIAEAAKLVDTMYQELRRPWATAELDGDGFRNAPADKIVSFEAMRDKHSGTYPVIYKKTALLDRAGVMQEGGINAAKLTIGKQTKAAFDLVFRVKGLMKPDKNDPLFVLNLLEPSPVLVHTRPVFKNNQPQLLPFQSLVYRVVQVAPAGPPESIDSVRSKVVEDLKLAAAYAKAGEFARRLAQRAAEVGLDAAVAEDAELKALLAAADAPPTTQPGEAPPPPVQYVAELGPFSPTQTFTRKPTFIQFVNAVSKKLHEDLFAMADAPTTSAVKKIALVPMADHQRWVIGELVDVQPVYAGAFEQQMTKLSQERQYADASKLQTAWFDPAQIRARNKYVPATTTERKQ